MSVEAGFDLGDLNDLNERLLNLAEQEFPKEAKKFIRRQGSKCETRLRNAYKSRVKTKTGNLVEGVGRGVPQQYGGSYQIRVYNKAPHAHLIEHGHVMCDKAGNPILDAAGQERWVDGKYVAAYTVEEYKKIYPEEVDKFVDEMLEKGLK